VSEDPETRERVHHVLSRTDRVVVSDSNPDVICIGCGSTLPSAVLELARSHGGITRIPVLLVTWSDSEELARNVLRLGVREYVRDTCSEARLASAFDALLPASSDEQLAGGEMLVGRSAAMRSTRAYVRRAAVTSCNVLITGETGTGKEVIAKLIHRNSARASKALICINCAAIPDTLFESELFGYERGAFTGAITRQEGKLKMADGGTVFFDEIGDLTPYAQAKLLRLLECREIQRLGSSQSQHIDIRIVAATNRDLEQCTGADAFRRDLYFRLHVAHINLPPLRERREDLLLLADSFRRDCNRIFGRNTLGFTAAAERCILSHDWPGNVRELKNIIEAGFIVHDPRDYLVDLPELLPRTPLKKQPTYPSEADRVMSALAEAHGNKSRAAVVLQCSRMTLYRKMERYGIDSDPSIQPRPDC
jgi:transcriptional regulator with PAS, ATPase and Fis domain